MRFTSILLNCALFASVSAGAIWVRQDSNQPPACSEPCLTPGTNNITLEGCAVNDIACQCRSTPYVQDVINCFARFCSSHDDVLTAIQFSTAYCAVEGVNTAAPGLTTPASQLPPSSAGTGATPAPSGTGAATTSTSTTSHSGVLGAAGVEPKLMLGAFLLAAVGVAAGL